MSKKDSSPVVPIAIAAMALLLLSTKGESQQPPSNPGGGSNPPTPPLTSDPAGYIIKNFPAAVESMTQTKVPYLVTLAQGGLESFWGNKAYGNNHFGIMAGNSWDGKTQSLLTWECGKTGNYFTDHIKSEIIAEYPPGDPKGNASCNSRGYYSYRVRAKFRAYDSVRDSYIDHGKFLRENSRYSKAFNYPNDPTNFALEISKAGYATAPNYAQVLLETMLTTLKVLKAAHLIS